MQDKLASHYRSLQTAKLTISYKSSIIYYQQQVLRPHRMQIKDLLSSERRSNPSSGDNRYHLSGGEIVPPRKSEPKKRCSLVLSPSYNRQSISAARCPLQQLDLLRNTFSSVLLAIHYMKKYQMKSFFQIQDRCSQFDQNEGLERRNMEKKGEIKYLELKMDSYQPAGVFVNAENRMQVCKNWLAQLIKEILFSQNALSIYYLSFFYLSVESDYLLLKETMKQNSINLRIMNNSFIIQRYPQPDKDPPPLNPIQQSSKTSQKQKILIHAVRQIIKRKEQEKLNIEDVFLRKLTKKCYINIRELIFLCKGDLKNYRENNKMKFSPIQFALQFIAENDKIQNWRGLLQVDFSENGMTFLNQYMELIFCSQQQLSNFIEQAHHAQVNNIIYFHLENDEPDRLYKIQRKSLSQQQINGLSFELKLLCNIFKYEKSSKFDVFISTRQSQRTITQAGQSLLHYGLMELNQLRDLSDKLQFYDTVSLKQYWEKGLMDFVVKLQRNFKIYSINDVGIIIEFLRRVFEKYEWTVEASKSLIGHPNNSQSEQEEKLHNYAQKLLAEAERFQQVMSEKQVKQVKEANTEKNYIDSLMKSFVEDQILIQKGKGITYVSSMKKEKEPLKHFIPEFFKISDRVGRYQSQMERIEATIKLLNSEKHKDQIERKERYMKGMAFERTANLECLGCSTFFYHNFNIFNPNACSGLLEVLPSVIKESHNEAKIKDLICGMMNSGGGVILFDCRAENLYVLAQGEVLTEKDKEKYEQKIMDVTKYIYPKISRDQVKVSFVPIFENPQRNQPIQDAINAEFLKMSYESELGGLRPNQQYFKRKVIKGLYVTRVRVAPSDSSKTYFWTQYSEPSRVESDQRVLSYCSVWMRERGTQRVLGRMVREEVTPAEMIKLVKVRFRKFYVPQGLTDLERRLLQNPQNCFNHECKDPESGTKIEEKNDNQMRETVQNFQIYSEEELASMNLSMLIARSCDIKQIKSRLALRGIKCDIRQMYAEYKFKPAKDTAALFHKIRFEDLLTAISHNPDFIFGGRPALVVSVTQYLRLNERHIRNQLSKEDFKNLRSWLKHVFIAENLTQWEFTTGDNKKEYFLQTESKRSTLFMYLLLNNYGEKASFKNPLHLDKLSPEERDKRWKQIN